ncbi:YbjN domain-containing protein [Paracoccus yeei]|uniref:YbjN domain-containing protein n=1 Tax=Paracoccus yeei TaxID=147645 RepID=A0A5P2QNM9_9RHOB|nr:YbjN domain-containing protein [Paracoccus yeei]QEU07233.1 YbjN domain-containing protein [Paracoccus yeei]
MPVLPALLFAAVLQTAPAPMPGQVLGDPAQIGAILSQLGLPVTWGRDVQGLTALESEIDGTLFNVYFYDCAPLCRRMQFVTGFTLTSPMTPEDANGWNRDHPFGKVVLTDEGQPYLEMDIGLAEDGLGRKNFEDALATWRDTLRDFRAAISN